MFSPRRAIQHRQTSRAIRRFSRSAISVWLIVACVTNTVWGLAYEYNLASVKTSIFNNNYPISTGNVAGVYVSNTGAVFSGFTLIADDAFNTAVVRALAFSNGIPVSTGRVAKVTVDKTVGTESGISIESDAAFNTAVVRALAFSNGIPVSTGRVARVLVDKAQNVGTGESIDNDIAYNIATVHTTAFNNGLPISSGKTAKVTIDQNLGATYTGFLNLGNDTFYNIVNVRTSTFNNGLPISSGKVAKVVVKAKINELDNAEQQSVSQEQAADSQFYSGSGTLVTLSSTSLNGGNASNVYTNSNHYIYQGLFPNTTVKVTENIQGGLSQVNTYRINRGNTLVLGDSGLFQMKVQKTKAGETLSYTGQAGVTSHILRLSAVITQDTISASNTIVTLTGVPIPPVLTYPYPTSSTGGYTIHSPYPIIKGMAMPDSVLRMTITTSTGSDIYYARVDSHGLFSVDVTRALADTTNLNVSFQYDMIGDQYATYRLKTPKTFTGITVAGTASVTQPYITSIYNDDEVDYGIFYLEGLANAGTTLSYTLSTLASDGTKTVKKTGATIVDPDTRRFQFFIGDSTVTPLAAGDYEIDVWQGTGKIERKAFTVTGNTKKRIGLINLTDDTIVPSLKPVIIGYSQENIPNQKTIRVEICDITGGGSFPIAECDPSNRRFLGTTNADRYGIFVFQSMDPLVDHRTYQYTIYNTTNQSDQKKFIVRTDSTIANSLRQSQVTSLFSGLNVGPSSRFPVEGYTASGVTVDILDSTSVNIGTTLSDRYGSFSVPIILPADGAFNVRFSSWGSTYTERYLMETDPTKSVSNTPSNLFQNFSDYSGERLIQRLEQ